MVRYLPNLTSVTCSSGTFKLKKITSELLAIPISRYACVDHHRQPQPSNQRYRRLRWSKAANFTQWFEIKGATTCLICHRQVGPFDRGSISHFTSFFCLRCKTLIVMAGAHPSTDPITSIQHGNMVRRWGQVERE
jgi:hypothetical protein